MLRTLKQRLRGQLIPNALLAEYTSWRVGGLAEWLFLPADVNDLVDLLQKLPSDLPITWLGLGSNVLIRDGGIDGIIIVTQGALHALHQVEAYLVYAEAGVSCAQIARHTARLGLTGLEFMAGVPGTVGGALAMNAGCYGGETWQRVQKVETLHRSGERKLRIASDYKVGYRHVPQFKNEWFIGGYFLLEAGERGRSLDKIRVLLEKRNASQPTGLPNCGSVFRNPPGDFAARLIEQCGLKGFTVGGACVSLKHANFIVNKGNATSAHIEELIARVALTVQQQHGVSLIPEVCIIGKEASR